MVDTPRVAVLSGFGINCETETMAVFEMAGAKAERVHVNRLVNGEVRLNDYHIMAVPGGFSFGDHLGSGRLMGNRLRFGLREQVREFVKSGKPVIGICNGFQVLVKMGLLPGDEEVSLTQTASLALNDSGHYENRWATLEFDSNSPCIWTQGMTRMRVPVRHGEGKFVTGDRTLLDEWAKSGQLVVRYVNPNSIQYHQTKVGETLRVFATKPVSFSALCPILKPIILLGWALPGLARKSSMERVKAWRYSETQLITLKTHYSNQ